MKKRGFSALPLVAMGVFDYMHRERRAAGYFESQWRADKTVVVKKFKRNVRAGGASWEVVAIVVRRKVASVELTKALDTLLKRKA